MPGVDHRVVVIGTSWGGLRVLRTIICGLPASFPHGVILVQHRHRDSRTMLEELLQENAALPIATAEDKTPIEPGHVYVAPPDYHLLVEEGYVSLSTEAPVKYSRPSIDVTLSSAAESYGGRTVGIVLTGANDDGAAGLRRIVDRGGIAIVENPATAESPTMPRAALAAVPTARVLTAEEIAPALIALVPRTPRSAMREARP